MLKKWTPVSFNYMNSLNCSGERLGRGIVTDALTTHVVNTSAYFFKKTGDLIDFKVLVFPIIAW